MIHVVVGLGFLLSAVVSFALGFYVVILGMAPGMPPLNLTGVFIYSPGPGFLYLIIWWLAAVGLYVAALGAGWLVQPSLRTYGTALAWLVLAGLIVLQLVILADFRGLL
ncbi:MAG: hypothetical protein H7Z42_15275 [Roseiflexaceae bacterium]|nr:hypothetical protein [Roseiflexaceae bacterium]